MTHAGTNVLQYTYDAAGNIKQIQRQASGGLAITGFDPTNGPVGAAVTIYGANFDANAANNIVKFNGTVAAVSAAAAGSLSTTVPSGATSGRITVAVGGVTATSAQDFIVTVPGVPAIFSFSPSSGTSTTSVAVSGGNFDTSAGGTTVKLNGNVASSSTSASDTLTFTVPAATASGRITATTSAGTGSSAQDFIVPPPGISASNILSSVHLVMGGAPSNLSIGVANKSGIALFDGSADTYYTVQFGQLGIDPTSSSVAYQVIKPDNSVLVSGNVGTSNRSTIHLPKLPTTGTYSVVVSPGSATFNSNISIAADPIIAIDGASVTVNRDSPSQSVRFVFDAAANQHVSIGGSGTMLSPATNSVAFSAYPPAGGTIAQWAAPVCTSMGSGNPAGVCEGEMTTGVAGTYTIVADTPIGCALAITIWLSNEASGTLTPDVGVDVALTRVGQDARYTFVANAGDSLAVNLSALTEQSQADFFNVTVLKPDGTSLRTCSAPNLGGALCELGVVPVTGTYTVYVNPGSGAYGTFHLALKQGTLISTTDPLTPFAPASNTEDARFRFSAGASQNMTVGLTALTTSPPNEAYLNVYSPTGAVIGSATCTPSIAGGTCKVSFGTGSAGTYAIGVLPPSGVKITGNVQVNDDLTGTLSPGVAQSLSGARAGQNARYVFAGTAGDSTSVKFFGLTMSPPGLSGRLWVLKPGGSYFASLTWGQIVSLPTLPITGNYTVFYEPAYGTTWSAQLGVDPGSPIAVDGAAANPVNAVAGEPLLYAFSGTAGQEIDIGLSGIAYVSPSSNLSSMQLSRPDGFSAGSTDCGTASPSGCDLSVTSLPVSGTYSLALTPPSGSSRSFANGASGGFDIPSLPSTGVYTVVVHGNYAATMSASFALVTR